MLRPSCRRPLVIAGVALLAAVLLPGQLDRERLPESLLFLAAAGTALIAAGWALAGRPARARWWSSLLLSGVGLAILTIAGLPLGRLDDATWTERQQRLARTRLDAAVSHASGRLSVLADFTARTAAAPTAAPALDPFGFCDRLVGEWWDAFGKAPLDSLAVVLWRGDQRLGWAGPVVAGGQDAQRADARRLFHDDQWWVFRETIPLPGDGPLTLECQLRLAAVEARGHPGVLDGETVGRTVVRDARPSGRRTWGDASRGLRLVEEIVLATGDEHGVQPRLRLEVQVPPRALHEDRHHARLTLARVVLLGLAVLSWAGAGWATGGFWLATWLVRGIWGQADLSRYVAVSLPGGHLPAAPDRPASLLDPAYFATTYAGGWFASSADALLTALILAGSAAWLWRRWRPLESAPPTTRRRWLLAAVPPLTVLLGVALARLGLEVAANANARLIGVMVPLDAWTFWVLHAVLVLVSVSCGLFLMLLALRAWGRLPGALTGAARPFWLAFGLLLVVVFNYTVLLHAYDQAERDWLRRKSEQIVQPQDDWIAFLLEDVLGEMAIMDTGRPDPTAAGGVGGALRREAPAYRLWQRSAVRDLGLPCLVEILAADGATESLFATGFLRDFSYEIVDRGDWWSLQDIDAAVGVPDVVERVVVLQEEQRLYPTGRERILRGEIPRVDQPGWLRLELPVQSRRVTTVLNQFTGSPDVHASGYRPRLEVDRPLLLLRGDAQGWLDAGFGELPDAGADRAIAALRDGRREWAVIDLDGRQWLCRWAPLPPAAAATPGEGFLLGLQQRGTVEVLLDLGRLILLSVLLLGIWVVVGGLARRRWRWRPGFQGRFLLGYLVIGVVLLLVAGSLADRQTFQRIDREARERTRDGLVTALGQLRGLLAEQARALAGSDYVAELLSGRPAAERPLGPYASRQGMVFGPAGELLLDETLSDLDTHEAARLLEAARQGPLVVMQQPEGLYLGVVIPLDLSGVLDSQATTGTFFYRQQIDPQLLPALAEVVGGEITLRLDGEVLEASHPGRVLGGENPLLAAPTTMEWFRRHPSQPGLQARASGLAFTGGVALPALTFSAGAGLTERALPAVLSVDFPDRERDYVGQRRQMALFLAGLITLLLLTALGLAVVLTWNIFEPLRVLLGATQRLATGDYAAPLPPSGTDEVGRLTAGFRTMRDRLREAQAVLAARERFLQAVLDQVPVGVLVWDAGGRLAAWNPAAAQILAKFYPGLPEGGGPEAWSRSLRQNVSDRLPPDGGELVSQDGRRTLRVGLAPLGLGDDQPHQLLVCEDLTDFLAAKKLALNAELARQVAHEIKNPLTPIQLSAQLLLQAQEDRHPQADAIVRDAVARILEQVSLLRSIAGEFSLLGRPGVLECTPQNLPALVTDLVAGYAGGGPRIEIAPQAVPPVLAHRESLQKVLGNLMQNCLDAVDSPSDLVVDVRWRVEADTVSLIWADNGPGIAPDVAARLFTPYFSTKSKGTGLGLAISRNLLDMMGGSITLASDRQAPGAVATVTLRRADTGNGRDKA